MVVSAERARQKAEARRLRILAKSSQRMDVVSGLAPSETVVSPTNADVETAEAVDDFDDVVVVDDSAPLKEGIDEILEAPIPTPDTEVCGEEKAMMAENVPDTESPIPQLVLEETDKSGENKEKEQGAGSRRMAAMRRRRYQKSPKVKVEESTTQAEGVNAESKEFFVPSGHKVDEDAVEASELSVTEAQGSTSAVEKKEEECAPAETKTEPGAVLPVDEDAPDEKKEEPAQEPKKYKGVARMRRKMLKEQKEKRLKELSEGSIAGDSGVAGLVEAEVATMSVTASMVREGTIDVVTGLAIDAISKKGKRKWYMKLLPPMHLLPRVVTLVLLFVAGLDMGLEPYRRSMMSSTSHGIESEARVCRGLRGMDYPMILHVETSLTKPWEYGMGGKVAYMIGVAPTSPPTAFPTELSIEEGMCTAESKGSLDCLAKELVSGETRAKKNLDYHHGKNGILRKLGNVFHGHSDHSTSTVTTTTSSVYTVDDEFDSHRPTVTLYESGNIRPRGVSFDDSEFDERRDSGQNERKIDPLFGVDLDRLLENAQLPFPIDAAARLAIGFHRTWVYYLWTLPAAALRSVVHIPKNFLTGLMVNPPVAFLISLFVRVMSMVLLGNGKYSLLESGDDDPTSAGKTSRGIGNLDVLGKLMETAKNYVGESFPNSLFVLGIFRDVLKIDMYVILCGMLVGLVAPFALRGILDGFQKDEGYGNSVLGEGEL